MAGNNNADISSQTIATTYDQVLHIGDTGNLSGCGAGNEKYIVDGSGTASTLSIGTARVGIGTATPNYMLDVETSGAIPSVRIGRNDASTGNIMGQLIFGNSTDDHLAGITAVEDGATDSGMLEFLVEKTGEGGNYAMIIDSNGESTTIEYIVAK